jgi:aminoglycoside phosphotransferase (APT) family kinase protein
MATSGLRFHEVPIDTGTVRRLIASQYPQWAELPVEPVANSGWDNATFRLGDALSVRLPRLPRWIGQVEREQRWLPFLAPRLPLPVPIPVAQGEPGEGYPFPWSVYRWIDGETADPACITDLHQTATELAGFFMALQAIDSAGGPAPEWSNGFRGTSFSDDRDSPIVESRVRAKIAALEGLADTDALSAVYESAAAAKEWDGPPVWIHGEPSPGNMLASAGRVTAVIDFGTVAVGDPACDLIFAWTFLDAGSRATFRAALSVDDAMWARGRGWGLVSVLPSPGDLTDPERGGRMWQRVEDLVADYRQGP